MDAEATVATGADLEHASELPKGKRRDNLIAGREQAFVSRELARLERHVPIARRKPSDSAGVNPATSMAMRMTCSW